VEQWGLSCCFRTGSWKDVLFDEAKGCIRNIEDSSEHLSRLWKK
jgi:hypothetical protein